MEVLSKATSIQKEGENRKMVFNTLREAARFLNMFLADMEEIYETKLPFIINDENEKFFLQY